MNVVSLDTVRGQKMQTVRAMQAMQASGDDVRRPALYAGLAYNASQLRDIERDIAADTTLALGAYAPPNLPDTRGNERRAEQEKRRQEKREEKARRHAEQVEAQKERQKRQQDKAQARRQDIKDERAARRAHQLALQKAKYDAKYGVNTGFDPYGYPGYGGGYNGGYDPYQLPYLDPYQENPDYMPYQAAPSNTTNIYSQPGDGWDAYGTGGGDDYGSAPNYGDDFGDEYAMPPGQLPQMNRDGANTVYYETDSGGAFDTLMGGLNALQTPAPTRLPPGGIYVQKASPFMLLALLGGAAWLINKKLRPAAPKRRARKTRRRARR